MIPTEAFKLSLLEQLHLIVLHNKELYGLQIPKAIASASNGNYKLSIGSLYPVLRSLERKGLVESRWGNEISEEKAGARRRYYKLSKSGILALETIQSFHSALLIWQPS